MLKRNQIGELCLEGESNRLDYKERQYAFENNASEGAKGELLKDVLAFANSNRLLPAYILIGVEELADKTGKIVGIAKNELLDDAHVQQFVNAKTNRIVSFRVYAVEIAADLCVQVIEIDAKRDDRPFYSRKDVGGVVHGNVYMRVGSSTTVASPEQIKEMGLDEAEAKARPVVELPDEVKVERDWSAVVVENATVDDLDESAVAQARKGFAEAHADRVTQEQIVGWPVMTLLEKVRLAVDGKLTRAALLLLGKREASAKLSPFVAQITWNLGGQRAYEHFGPPFILTTTEVYRKIRNFNLSIVPKDSMLPVVVPRYIEKVILEPLHNCIAHQDYALQERIVVTEYDDHVELENAGSFFEGTPLDYVDGRKRPRFYRNRLLAEAMADLHMIDAMGYGIHDIYAAQRARYLPMPDYVTTKGHVVAKVYGKVFDDAYSRLLIAKADMPLDDVVNLDRVQKHLPISSAAVEHLRKLNYVEGRVKQLRVTSTIASLTDKRAEYIQLRATDDANLKRMVVDYITQFGSASRQELNRLLLGKMHEALSEKEKHNKVGNLLAALKNEGRIQAEGVTRSAKWVLNTTVFKGENM